MSVKLEQVAIGVRKDSAKFVRQIINILGARDWVFDTVKFSGEVFGEPTECTVANLNFNYDLIPGVEFEILEYTEGENWHKARGSRDSDEPFISHIGFHAETWKEFCDVRDHMIAEGIQIAQLANTFEHSNENVPENRKYTYLIFDSVHKFGFDLKLIYRRNTDDES